MKSVASWKSVNVTPIAPTTPSGSSQPSPGFRSLQSPTGTQPSPMLNNRSTPSAQNSPFFNRGTPTSVSQPKSPMDRSTMDALSKVDVIQPRMRMVSDPNEMPIPTVQSRTIPPKMLGQPPDRYLESRKVNSRAEAKGEYRSPVDSPKGIPQFVGSTFSHLPNAANRPLLPPSKLVTTARPHPVLTSDAYNNTHSGMLSNRSPNGAILGSPAKRFVPQQNIPYLPPDQPLGPDNPVKQLNETWSACWDNEAGATYYYNHTSGEATWLKPDL